MKLVCDICGRKLQMNPNNTGAVCTNCGMNYSVESLRNKLNGRPNIPPPPAPTQNAVSPVTPQNSAPFNQQNNMDRTAVNTYAQPVGQPSAQSNPPYAQTPTPSSTANNPVNRALVVEMKPGGIVAKAYGIVVIIDGVAQPMITQKSGAIIIPVCPGEHVISAEVKHGGTKTESVIKPMRFCVSANNWYGLFSFHRGAWKSYFKLELLEDLEGRLNDVKV